MKHGSDYIPLRSSTWKLIFCAGLVIFVFAVASAQKPSASKFTVKPLALPGASGLVMLDYLAYDRTSRRLWVPAGNTGSVDVIDATTDEIKRVSGFPVTQVEFRGKLRPVGPSSVAVGDGVVYVGSRADSKICPIDSRSLKLDNCFEFAPPSAGMAAAPDALIYILATREVWATTGAPPVGVPADDRAVQILSAAQPVNLSRIGKIPLHGSAEGYALDNLHGRFNTNLEETGQTVAIDVRKRAVVNTWRSCDDPSGVAVDSRHSFVFVACSDHVIVLDTVHDGRVAGSIPVGKGVDNIAYDEDSRTLYAAAAEAAQLTIAHVDENGSPTVRATVPTTKGGRSVVVGSNGCAYVIDPLGGRILKIQPG